MRNRQRNRVKALSLVLLKERGTTVGKVTAIEERQNDGGEKPSPFPIQCGWDTMGHALINETHPAQWNDVWSDGMWPGYGPPVPQARREKQGAIVRRQLSAFLGGTWEDPNNGISARRDHRAS